jgi:hypothetical protein
VRGEEIRVPRDADDAALEAARVAVEKALNAVTERAYALARNGKPDAIAAASALRRTPFCCTKSA